MRMRKVHALKCVNVAEIFTNTFDKSEHRVCYGKIKVEAQILGEGYTQIPNFGHSFKIGVSQLIFAFHWTQQIEKLHTEVHTLQAESERKCKRLLKDSKFLNLKQSVRRHQLLIIRETIKKLKNRILYFEQKY